ncbi:unnamed protein product [Rotaria magnacalcarata]|uniref:Uncharacterized protein n=1 Tax=Rotaria magnacalcarata TaxID=392030 RepID=A0A816S1M7_9BILA|nr:unnamed protein product [Rotaria magnacalcarata]CAF3957050.1 unnamed protein product [Rotaria magnacalcarata]
MHRHGMMYNNVCTHHPPVSYHHHGINVCSSYDVAEPLPTPTLNCSTSSYCHDYAYRRDISYCNYPCYDCVSRVFPPPITLTNVRNDIRYVVDDPEMIYDDDYGSTYRLSRSKVQLVDFVPKHNVRTNSNHLTVSNEPRERIILPRSTVVRQASVPIYERRKPVRLVPLYRSAEPQYLASSRIPMTRKLVPLATVYHPQRRTIKVRSLSP